VNSSISQSSLKDDRTLRFRLHQCILGGQEQFDVFYLRDGSNRHRTQCRSKKHLDKKSKSREISASWRSAPRAASTLFRTSQHRSFLRNTLHSINTRLSTARSPPDTQTNTSSYFNPFPGKENSNCVLCPPRSKTSSPSVCRPNFPTTSGPDRLPPRLDSVAWTSFTLTHSICDGASSEPSSCLPGVRAT
jgi:hypothetical protein